MVVSHNSSFDLWTTGGLSSPGVAQVATTGQTTIILTELAAAQGGWQHPRLCHRQAHSLVRRHERQSGGPPAFIPVGTDFFPDGQPVTVNVDAAALVSAAALYGDYLWYGT